MHNPPPKRTLRYTLAGLKNKGLIHTKGRGQWAVWFLSENALEGSGGQPKAIEGNENLPKAMQSTSPTKEKEK